MIILFVEEGLRRLTTAQRDENKVYEIKGVEVCVLRNLLFVWDNQIFSYQLHSNDT